MATEQEESQKQWKSDFPIQQAESVHVSRREFAKFLCLLSGGIALGNGAIVAKALLLPVSEVEGEHFVCNVQDIPVGEMKQFSLKAFREVPYILIRLSEDKWRAFEQKCTHLSCAVRYRSDLKKIECPCHKGYFDAETGVVLQGPPPRPLPQLEVILKDGKVYVKAMSEISKQS